MILQLNLFIMKKGLIICFYLVFGYQGIGFGQDLEIDEPKDTTYWNSEISFGLNFNQASFSGNWKAGESTLLHLVHY